MRLFAVVIVMITSFFMLSGCATTGSAFVQVETPPVDKAAIYFYRRSMFSGAAVSIKLLDNGGEIYRIQNGQFIRYLATPGKHEFRTDVLGSHDKAVEFDLEAGKTYFVRIGFRNADWIGLGTWYLTRVYPDEAIGELQACCKSGE
jgi:hypothetical protein